MIQLNIMTTKRIQCHLVLQVGHRPRRNQLQQRQQLGGPQHQQQLVGLRQRQLHLIIIQFIRIRQR